MKSSHLVMHPRPEDPGNPTTRSTERPLKIRVVFDEDDGARRADVLIQHVTAGLECDIRSFAFDDLELPEPAMEAARSASDTDILMVAVRDDHSLPAHMRSWLGLYLALRDKSQEGVLVVLIATPAETVNPDSSLAEYLETVAAIGGLSFIPSRRSVAHNSASNHPPGPRRRVPRPTMNSRRVCQWAGRVCGLAGLLLIGALVNPSSAWGEEQSVPPLTLSLASPTPPTPHSIWNDGVGNGFHEDTFDAGFSLGAGFGVRVFGGTVAHDLALASGHFGWVFTDVVAEDKWWRGNWEWLNELFSGGQFSPRDHYFIGWTTGLRYNFATGTRWVPFIDGGVGLSGTDIDSPDLDGTFQFNVQVGAGTHYFLTDNTAVTFQYRWLHFSDGGTTRVNHGVNTEMFESGLTWFF